MREILIALSSVGAVLAATHSRRARTLRKTRITSGMQPSTSLKTSSSSALPRSTSATHPSHAPTTTAPSHYPTLAALIFHTLLCMLAVVHADTYTSNTQDAPRFTVLAALYSIASLAIHAGAIYLLQHYNLYGHSEPHLRSVGNSNRTTNGMVMTRSKSSTQPQHQDINVLAGMWMKNKELSDCLDPALDLIELHGIVRMAVSLLAGVEIRITDDGQFKFAVCSSVRWFKITETYPLSGEQAKHRRRDLRRGGHLGKLQQNPATGAVTLHLEFGEPLGGVVEDTFYCPEPDVLHIDTVMTVRGQTVKYKQVYNKQQ